MLEPLRGLIETGNAGVDFVGYTGVVPLLQREYVKLVEEFKTRSWVPKSVINAAYCPHCAGTNLLARQRHSVK